MSKKLICIVRYVYKNRPYAFYFEEGTNLLIYTLRSGKKTYTYPNNVPLRYAMQDREQAYGVLKVKYEKI